MMRRGEVPSNQAVSVATARWAACIPSGFGSGTYVPSPRDMLDIVLGTQARGHMAVVHLFGDYLNL